MEKFLASSGKEILIKSVTQAIPTYSMSVIKLTRGWCKHLNIMVHKFYWGIKKGKEDGVGI